jgi:hypothetical protein
MYCAAAGVANAPSSATAYTSRIKSFMDALPCHRPAR